ncbi:hypothetical protein VNI00_007782 [Paramarasmius palmivorus]|uniref:FAD-binding PCMH-type domain-containing protein n=1 Tax=Paramarasmius palmivorus TaxID=297713 RepID=A0AAW0CZ28_9AGAR
MDPIFLNKSCDPFDPRDTLCQIGAYVQYAVNVSTPEHVTKTIEFVKEHNIRFVVKNTGHDYMGRSTGTGAISVWMHHLTDITFIPEFQSSWYSGPAFKISAGVLGIDLVRAASQKGLAITVGLAGGYMQGGGHSMLSSFYGLAADQSLEFEVITTEGQLVNASPTENADLYWALSGGGGGTYGIVWSATVKAHADLPITLATFEFSSAGLSEDDYWDAVRNYSAITPTFSDSKVWSIATITNTTFTMNAMVAVNKTTGEVATLIEPIRQTLDDSGIRSNLTIQTFNSYLDTWDAVPFFAVIEVADALWGSRLMPPSIWEDEISFQKYINTVRTMVNTGVGVLDMVIAPSLEVAGFPSNAVHPAWREISHMLLFSLPIENGESPERIAKSMNRITTEIGPLLVKLAPNTGAYLNEADPNEPNFKQSFYGANYDRLLSIKDKYDPLQLLYGSIAVGGDRWEEVENGRLCRTRMEDRFPRAYMDSGLLISQARERRFK